MEAYTTRGAAEIGRLERNAVYNACRDQATIVPTMAFEGIKELVSLGGQTHERNFVQFFAILARPRSFVKSIDHDRPAALIGAATFAVFVSVVNLAIMLPAFRLANIQADTSAYILFDTVITFIFWFLYGTLYHLCARLVKGRGSYRSSMVAYLYLTAFNVISGVFALPASLTVIPWTLQSADVPTLGQWESLGRSLFQSPATVICSLLSSATVIYLWICRIGAFMIVHQVGRAKGLSIGLLGAGLSLVIFLAVEKPVVQLFWQAFSS